MAPLKRRFSPAGQACDQVDHRREMHRCGRLDFWQGVVGFNELALRMVFRLRVSFSGRLRKVDARRGYAALISYNGQGEEVAVCKSNCERCCAVRCALIVPS